MLTFRTIQTFCKSVTLSRRQISSYAEQAFSVG